MKLKKTYCMEGRHMSYAIDIEENEKRKPQSNKIAKVRKGKRDVCGRPKGQVFST